MNKGNNLLKAAALFGAAIMLGFALAACGNGKTGQQSAQETMSAGLSETGSRASSSDQIKSGKITAADIILKEEGVERDAELDAKAIIYAEKWLVEKGWELTQVTKSHPLSKDRLVYSCRAQNGDDKCLFVFVNNKGFDGFNVLSMEVNDEKVRGIPKVN